jgi:hypothetical protein
MFVVCVNVNGFFHVTPFSGYYFFHVIVCFVLSHVLNESGHCFPLRRFRSQRPLDLGRDEREPERKPSNLEGSSGLRQCRRISTRRRKSGKLT